MKINSKKTLLVLAAVALVGGTFTAVALTKENGFSVSAAEDENTIWKHYAAVAPTFTSHGSKEFWANCSEIGTHVFEEPKVGKIQEGDDFSKTVYFKELTPMDDRYVAKLTPKVTFDSRGGTVIESQDVEYNALAVEPTAPTREADAYYDAYTFDGWYANGKKFDFTKPVTGNVELSAKWKYGKTKTIAVSDKWTKDNFTIGEKAIIRSTIRESFNIANWSYFQGDSTKLQAACDEFGYKDSDGVCFFPTDDGPMGSVTAPGIDFKTLLKQYGKIYMSVGIYNGGSSVYFNNGTVDTIITYTKAADPKTGDLSEQGISSLTRTLLTFFADSDGKVHMTFDDVVAENPYSRKDGYGNLAYGDIILSDAQANGTSGLIFKQGVQGQSRFCWLERPYALAGGTETVLNVSAKTGYTVTDATSETMTESNKSGWGQWKSFVMSASDGIGLRGNGSGSSVLTFDKYDFSSLLEQKKGVKFTIGMWNGNEHIYYGSGAAKEDLGLNENRPSNDPSTYTRKQMVDCTYLNWNVFIDSLGVRVHNNFEDKDYFLTLSADQRKGNESLVFSLGNRSDGRIILVSNWTTYRA